MFLATTTACYADSLQTQGAKDKNFDCSAITPTAFSTQLKKSPSYNAPSYNMPYYSNFIQSNPLINASMGGLVNSMTLGSDSTSCTPQMMQRQQEEYTRQQLKAIPKDEIPTQSQEPSEPPEPAFENTNNNAWW